MEFLPNFKKIKEKRNNKKILVLYIKSEEVLKKIRELKKKTGWKPSNWFENKFLQEMMIKEENTLKEVLIQELINTQQKRDEELKALEKYYEYQLIKISNKLTQLNPPDTPDKEKDKYIKELRMSGFSEELIKDLLLDYGKKNLSDNQ